MTRKQQRVFVKELTDTVRKDMLHIMDEGRIPEEWDGHELRAWIAEHFAACVIGHYTAELKIKTNTRDNRASRTRLRDYRNAVLTGNLI